MRRRRAHVTNTLSLQIGDRVDRAVLGNEDDLPVHVVLAGCNDLDPRSARRSEDRGDLAHASGIERFRIDRFSDDIAGRKIPHIELVGRVVEPGRFQQRVVTALEFGDPQGHAGKINLRCGAGLRP